MNERREIKVSAYDSRWPSFFESEAIRLADTFSSSLIRLHHIGSTAVPDLVAKPTIDIAIELVKSASIPDYYPAMESLGYRCRGECLDAIVPGTPGRFYFVLYDGLDHLFHIHVYRTGHWDLQEKVILRDYLRSHPEVVQEYGKHKIENANANRFDNVGYMQDKDVFVKQMIRDAHKWALEMMAKS